MFSQRRAKNTENHVVKENVKIKFELPDKPTDLQTENEHSAKDNILNEIVEKNTSGNIKVNLPSLLNDTSTSKHFPNAMKIPSFKPNLATTSVKNNKSLFAQQFMHMKRDMAEMDVKTFKGIEDVEDDTYEGSVPGGTVNTDCFGQKSRLVSGLGLEKCEEVQIPRLVPVDYDSGHE